MLRFYPSYPISYIENLTLREVDILFKSYKERYLDEMEKIHLQAFLNLLVKSTDKRGKKYRFSEFKKFFDRDKFFNKGQKNEPIVDKKNINDSLKFLSDFNSRRKGVNDG